MFSITPLTAITVEDLPLVAALHQRCGRELHQQSLQQPHCDLLFQPWTTATTPWAVESTMPVTSLLTEPPTLPARRPDHQFQRYLVQQLSSFPAVTTPWTASWPISLNSSIAPEQRQYFERGAPPCTYDYEK